MNAAQTGIIVIGRNEGERLVRCLDSLPLAASPAVYVDSGSTDDSVAVAESRGARVLRLDMSIPFNAGRARREGVEALLAHSPDVAFLQFVDGDCEVETGWLETAHTFLDAHPDVAVVCGRRRERFPRASVYNRLCDMEWDSPVGEATACGGDSLMRVSAYRTAGGFSASMVAGEEPELCSRIRKAGWKVHRIDAPMTIHDAAMLRFGQWWMRGVRGGFGYAQVNAQARSAGLALYQAEVRRAWIWAALVPVTICALAMISPAALIALPAVYGLQIVRIAARRGFARRTSWEYALFAVLAKFPELQGILRYRRQRFAGKAGTAILYK